MNRRLSKSVVFALILLSAAASLAWCVRPAVAGQIGRRFASYIRVQRDSRGKPTALETAIVRFVPQGNDHPGLEVDLVSAIHIADKKYYEALNKRFADCDVVLYELVAPEGTQIPKGGGDRDRNALSSMQNSLTDLLDLQYQLAGVDYSRKNFVHADLSPEQFAKSMEDKGESVWSILMRLMAASMAQQAGKSQHQQRFRHHDGPLLDRDRPLKLKRIFAEQFADVDNFMAAFNGPEGSTLITERNKVALKELKTSNRGRPKKNRHFLRRRTHARHARAPDRRFPPQAGRHRVAGSLEPARQEKIVRRSSLLIFSFSPLLPAAWRPTACLFLYTSAILLHTRPRFDDGSN